MYPNPTLHWILNLKNFVLQYDRALYQSEFTQLILFNIIQALHSSTHSQLKDKKKQKQDWIKWCKKEQRKQKQSQKMQD